MPFDPDQLRAACAEVASLARHVRVRHEAIVPYAASLSGDWGRHAATIRDGPLEREALCAHWLTLDAINFGSGWFPTLRKRPGLSGYRTIAAGLGERFDRSGPWTAAELRTIDTHELATVLGQEPEHELIGHFVASLRDLGRQVGDGGFTAVLDGAGDSAVALAARLSQWACYADASAYRGIPLPFLKRAQIVAADLQRAGAASFADLDRLTIFADNLVPHVLTLDGILELSVELRRAIAAGELLEHGSEPEVELRACAVHAAELLVGQIPGMTAARLDGVLWERGGQPFYKASPRPRSRCTAY